jgi:hypothetical protein
LANTSAQGTTTITATAQATNGQDVTGAATLHVTAPVLVVNEVLVDPPDGIAGDANHDGTRSGTDDEFIELVNASSAPLDLGGWTIRTRSFTSSNETLRHTFAAGTSLAAGDCVVIFGGGSFDANDPVFGGAQVFKALSGGLSLTNSGLTIIVRDAAALPAAQFAYGTAHDEFGGDSINQSITRAPDITGAFIRHTLAAGANVRKFSPGTKLDGSFFVPRTGRLTRVTLATNTTTIAVGATAQFTAQALDQFDRALSGVAFNFTSSDASIAAITNVTPDNDAGRAVANVGGLRAGTTQIKATANDGAHNATSNELTLQVIPPPPIVQRVVVSPQSASINRGQAEQFTVQAFDQNDNLVPNASFSWTTSDAQAATVNADGLARGVGLGAVSVVATTPNGVGDTVTGQADLHVLAPLVINEILADVPPDNINTQVVEGDANRDGVRSATDDEFIELLNNSNAPLDLSGVVVADATSNRFTFPPSTTLEGGRSVVIFGGGAPPLNDPAFGGALILKASALGLNDGGDTITIKLPAPGGDIVIAVQAYGTGATGAPPAPSDQSLTRAPDAEVGNGGGNFVAHSNATNAAARIFSPGTRADGTPFGSSTLTRIEVAPASAQVEIGAQQSFTAHAFSMINGAEMEVPNVSFIWDASDATKATLNPATGANTTATALAAGTTNVRAQAGGRQATADLIVNPPPPVLTKVELTPTTAAVIVGQTQQFTARALDQFNQPFAGASYSFNSDDTNIAQIVSMTNNADGSASASVSGHAAGTAHITATATSGATIVMSDAATLTVGTPPPVPTAGQVIINEALVSFATSSTQPRADFVELYNPTTQTLDISSLVISFRPSGNSNTPSTVTLPGAVGSLTTLILPHNYFLIGNGANTFGVAADFNAQTLGFDLNNTTGGIKLELNGVKLDGLTYQGGSTPPVATFIAYGEGTLFTFTSGTTNDLIRSPNANDTDNNAPDFRRNGTAASVTPKAANPTLP